VTTFTTLQAEETNLEHDLGDQADQRAELAQQPPAPEEPAAVLEQFQARIEELTQERDQAHRALNQARQELDLAHRVQLRAVGPDHPSRCSVCLKQRNAVKAMFTSPRRHHQFSICNECIDEMYQASNEFIAKGGPSMQPSLVHQNDHPSLPAAMTVIEHAESFWVQDARPGGPAQTDRPG
jgi:hypothetical protein